MINSDILKDFLQARNWAAFHGMLDDARQNAVSADEIRSEIGWRLFVLKQQQRYDEALALLYDKQSAFDCRSYVKAQFSRLFTLLGRDEEALDVLRDAPFDSEMTSFYGLAMDAKFSYFYLLAKNGDVSVKERLSEIPDDYEHITMDGRFLTKSDILALLV